jgi:hypothetical protein
VVAASYLLAIWARYRADAEDVVTPALRRRVVWLCELAAHVAAALETTEENAR